MISDFPQSDGRARTRPTAHRLTGPLMRARFCAPDQRCAAYATSLSASPDGLLSATR